MFLSSLPFASVRAPSSVARPKRNWKSRAVLCGALLTVLTLAACAAPQRPAPPVTTAPTPEAPDTSRWLNPRHLDSVDPVRVALLLPLQSGDPSVRQLAQTMLDAAQLALFDQSGRNFVLMPKDTDGTAASAAAAAREAIDQGAEMILGPLFAQSVGVVAHPARARNIPVRAFSTDISVAGDGVYLLSFQPENEVRTVTQYAASQGANGFAALIPEGAYGQRVADVYRDSVAQNGGYITSMEIYPRQVSLVEGAVRRLVRSPGTLAGLEEEKQRLRDAGDEASMQALERLESDNAFVGAGFDAVLIPEEGNLLRSLAPLLAYYGVNTRRVRLLGTGLWDDPDIAREPSLLGGWFAAPAPEMRQAFAISFEQSYGRLPPRVASLAYDGVMLAATLADGPRGARFRQSDITDPNGFFGIDGIFRFTPDGRAERGLAVIEITREGFQVVSPAPTSFQTIGF